MKKQPEITEATRNAFIQVFCEFYQTRPIDKITVKEIAAKAGYSRVTFYNYFADVYDLREYVEDEFISRLVERVGYNIARRQVLDSFVHTFLEILQENRLYINVFMNASNISSFADRVKMKITPLLIAAFGVAPENMAAKYALEFHISGLVSVVGSWLRNGRDISDEALAGLIKGILQEGILRQLTN